MLSRACASGYPQRNPSLSRYLAGVPEQALESALVRGSIRLAPINEPSSEQLERVSHLLELNRR